MIRWLCACACLAVLLVAAGCKKDAEADKGKEKAESPEAQKHREEAVQCVNALFQLKIAAANYQDSHGVPCFSDSSTPVKGWTWRIRLSPYLEYNNVYNMHFATRLADQSLSFTPDGKPAQGEKVAEQFEKIARDSPIKLYTLPRYKDKPGMTVYHRVVSTKAPMALIVVETAKLTPWTLPGDDLIPDKAGALGPIEGNFPPGHFALCGDGQVRLIPKGVTGKDLLAALEGGKEGTVMPENPEEVKKALAGVSFEK
jgi:hypothetical protein